jgi:hypothetical protein
VTAESDAIPLGSYLKSDGDQDKDDGNPVDAAEHTDTLVDVYGRPVDQLDKRAVTILIKRYYAAAVARDDTEACLLLASTLATGLAEGQGQGAGGDGKTCASVVAPLFEQQHAQLAEDDVATMVVIAVRVKGDIAMATLGFRTMPVGKIFVKRERGTWKMDALLDTGLS